MSSETPEQAGGDTRLLTPADVAERLNVTEAQVYTLLRNNELPGLKIGRRGLWRVDPSQLADYIEILKRDALARVDGASSQ